MAAYLCPDLTTTLMEAKMEGMPCAGMDSEKPVHCAEFSADTKASLEHHHAPPSLVPLAHAALVRILLPLPRHVLPPPAGAIPEQGADPPYLRTLRIRI